MMGKKCALLVVELLLVLGLAVVGQEVDLTTWGIPSAGSMPRQLALSSSGSVFFAEYGTSKIGMLDPHANTISERSVPYPPSGLVTSGANSFYYTTPNHVGISLLVFDGGGHGWTAPDPSSWLEYLASAPSGPGVVNLWVTERKGSAVARFSPSSTAVTLPFIISPSTPVSPNKSTITGVATSVTPQVPSGGIPLASLVTPSIGMTSGPFTEWHIASISHLERVAIAPDGNVWVSDLTSALSSLDPAHNLVAHTSLPAGTMALGIAVAASGDVWFTDTSRPAIGKFDPTTNETTLWPILGGTEPFDLITTSSGGIWFTDRGSDAIGFLDPSTNEIIMYSLPAGSHPTYLVSDGSISVWFVAEGGNYVGWLSPKITLAPQPLHTASAASFTGYNINRSGNTLQGTADYTYDGSSGLPVWVSIDMLSGGVLLAGFSSVPSVINQAGEGTASLSLIYNGAQSATSDQIVIRMYDGEGTTVISETIDMQSTWNP
ncbi:MAG TPA: hypothetical protein ENL23_02130 [Candidatus Acetothermia bacterium]|nr:hypothetical protein [Candidatus Acetothermia bacterium]